MSTKSTIKDIKGKLDQLIALRDASAAETERLSVMVSQLEGALAVFESDLEEEEAQLPAKTLRNAMVEILQERMRSIHYSDLPSLIEERGIEVRGKDPLRLVAAHLSNDERFKSIGNGIWGLASWPAHVLRQPEPERRVSLTSNPKPTLSPPVSLADRVRGIQPPIDSETRRRVLSFDDDEFSDDPSNQTRSDPTGTHDDVPF